MQSKAASARCSSARARPPPTFTTASVKGLETAQQSGRIPVSDGPQPTISPAPLPPTSFLPPIGSSLVQDYSLSQGLEGWDSGMYLWIPSRRCLCVCDNRTLPPQAACGAKGIMWALALTQPTPPLRPKAHLHPHGATARDAGTHQQLPPGGQRPPAQ